MSSLFNPEILLHWHDRMQAEKQQLELPFLRLVGRPPERKKLLALMGVSVKQMRSNGLDLIQPVETWVYRLKLAQGSGAEKIGAQSAKAAYRRRFGVQQLARNKTEASNA